MADAARKVATYDDVLSAPPADAHWSLLATFADDERVRAEPFDAIELELGLLWADVEPVATKYATAGTPVHAMAAAQFLGRSCSDR